MGKSFRIDEITKKKFSFFFDPDDLLIGLYDGRIIGMESKHE